MTTGNGRDEDLAVVAIGASAGGLEALREVFAGHSGLPGMAFVVVQHLDPNHDSLMAQLLERHTDMVVTQASDGDQLERNHIYVIPPGHGLAVAGGVLHLTEFKDPRGLRRPIDDFFESLAEDRRNRSACVILSGTGGDGSRGLRAIKEYGGLAVAQEPATARYDGMPVSAIATGLVDIILPPAQIIEALGNFFARAEDIELDEAEEAANHVDDMCAALRDAVGHDFSGYKRSTLSRRIARRMQVIGVKTSGEYLARLKQDADECKALFRDLLINVTRFFRDSEEFGKLREMVIEPLVASTRDGGELRMWVAGCSSGEEAYSLAMLVAETMQSLGRRPYVQIFATDIDDKMLDIAREATYPLAALADIPIKYHADCLTIGMDSFTIAPRIRDMVRFSAHNLVRDPPFSKISLLSCRNLLIYFDERLQREVLPAFHFALSEGGYLFLGSSETIGRFEDLFQTVDQRARIFARREGSVRYPMNFTAAVPARRTREASEATRAKPRPLEMLALSRLAERHAPVSFLVDSEGSVFNKWGDVARFMNFPERADGALNILRQARPGLEVLGPILRDCAKACAPRIARDVSVTTPFGTQPIAVIVEPVGNDGYLVVLRETGAFEPRPGDGLEEFERGESEIDYLQDELQTARLLLRTTVEELETTNEELKSSNEEMMSMNEELQSTNEELTTVNDELKEKIDQVTTANADLKNFFESTDLVVIVVDRNLEIRSFTEAAKRIFSLGDRAIGQQLARVESEFSDDRYLGMASEAARVGKASDYRAMTRDGKGQYIARVIPYRLLNGSIAGATLVFTDVSTSLRLESELAEERARLRMALEVAQIGIWEYEPATGRTVLDAQERHLIDVGEEEAGDDMEGLLARLPAEDRDRVNGALRRAMDGKQLFNETFCINLRTGGTRWLHGLGRKLVVGDTEKFIGVTYDVTREQQMLAERELMLREMNHRVKNLFAIITAMIKLSSRKATSIEQLTADVCERIYALGRSHSLTVDNPSGETPLRTLLEVAVKPVVNGQQVIFDGPEVALPYRLVTPCAMIFHEWVTNSSKYGALAISDGHIAVNWAVKDGLVHIGWHETNFDADPSVQDTPGFGTQMIAASARQISGKVGSAPQERGYMRNLEFPISS